MHLLFLKKIITICDGTIGRASLAQLFKIKLDKKYFRNS